jgi:hypothetical protein
MRYKTFDYKGQMINYLKKMKSNKKLTFYVGYLDAKTGKYTISYCY